MKPRLQGGGRLGDSSGRVNSFPLFSGTIRHLNHDTRKYLILVVKEFVDYLIWQGSVKQMHLSLEFHYYSFVRPVSEHISAGLNRSK